MTQAERPPATSSRIRPCGPTSGGRRRPSKFSPRTRFSRLGPPLCRTDRRRGQPLLATHGSGLGYGLPGKGRGTSPHPPGIHTGGRAGRGMAKGSWWRDATDPRKRPLRAKDPGSPRITHVVTTYRKYIKYPAEPAVFLSQSCLAHFAELLAVHALQAALLALSACATLEAGSRPSATQMSRPALAMASRSTPCSMPRPFIR